MYVVEELFNGGFVCCDVDIVMLFNYKVVVDFFIDCFLRELFFSLVV